MPVPTTAAASCALLQGGPDWRGAIFASVTKKEFSAQELLEPPERLKRAFQEVTAPCDEQIRILHLQNRQLRAARDLLLPRLMSGEIAV